MTIQQRTAPVYEPHQVILEGSEPVRAYLSPATDRDGAVMPAIPQVDFVNLIGQFEGLNVRLERRQAVVFSDDGSFTMTAPVVFLEGVGLKCFDLRGAGWDFRLDTGDGLPAAA